MRNETISEPRACESKPPEKRESIEKVAAMLDEFDPAYVEQLSDKLRKELNVLPPTEPPTNCDRAPTLAECKRIKALYPKTDLNHENLWYNVCDDFDAAIGKHGWECLLDVAQYAERWKPGDARKASPVSTDADADDGEAPKRRGVPIGEQMPINHFFTGWAENVENAQAMLKAVSCFTNEEDRFTVINGDDGLAIEQMVQFVDRELTALVKRLNMAGDHDNPRVVTNGGYVWTLNTIATLSDKPSAPA